MWICEHKNLKCSNVLYLPMVKFEHPEQTDAIFKFLEAGGTVITSDPCVFAYDDWGRPTEYLRKKMFGVTGLKKRSAGDNTIRMQGDYSGISIKPYLWPYEIEHTDDVEVIGLYCDGGTAAVCNKVGKGKAYFFASSVLDTYLYRRSYTDSTRDTGRGELFKRIESENNCPDLSWIWDINVDNVHLVVGTAELEPVEIDENIVFEAYQTPIAP